MNPIVDFVIIPWILKGEVGVVRSLLLFLVEYEMVSIVGNVIILTSDGNPFGMWPRYKNNCSNRSMEVKKLPSLLGNGDRQNDRRTERGAHIEVLLPIIKENNE